jgi:hypothetical protein
MADVPPTRGARLDVVGTVFSALGLSLIVYGVLRVGSWGFFLPKPEAPSWLGVSPVLWLLLGGGLVLRWFLAWEKRRSVAGLPALVNPDLLRNGVLRGGLTAFFFQYLVQAGVFFTVPLFLSVALGLSAVGTGLRILPLSLALLVTAIGIPRFLPHVSPRRVVRSGFVALLVGIVALEASLEAGVGPEVVTVPLLLVGAGTGALASQLGSVTVSSMPDELSGEVGGLQNTVTNLGASLGTALAGAVLISALSSSFFAGIASNPDVPADLTSQTQVELASGVPFIADDQLTQALTDAGVAQPTADAVLAENEKARLDGLQASLSVLALIALAALFGCSGIPDRQPGDSPAGPGAPQTASGAP